MDRLRKRMATACSGARDEAAACSGTGIEDDKWRQWCNGFYGDRRVRESAGTKNAICGKRERGA
jgi:hypothetical protein